MNTPKTKKRNNYKNKINALQASAFEIYCSIPEHERSLKKLVEICGQDVGRKGRKLTRRQVESWSVKYRWQEKIEAMTQKRVQEAEKEAGKAIQRSSLETVKEQQAEMTRIAIGRLLKKFQDAINAGMDPAFSYKDFEKMMKHQLIIHGFLKESTTPTTINPLNIVQVQLTPEATLLDKVLTALDPETRMRVCQVILRQKKLQQQQHQTDDAVVVEDADSKRRISLTAGPGHTETDKDIDVAADVTVTGQEKQQNKDNKGK